ncbi:MAG TPA: NAD-binding protein [Candidatus Dormibacteraeota bacterium]|nr:NAD-binding protein [Candidatus Dormibacteraeota bacterium]
MAVGGHTVICGLERISVRVARALIQLGERVTIVADTPEPALLREARQAGARMIEGVTSEIAHIHGLGLDAARCIVLTEDADLRNVQAALAARERNPGIRVVLRMFNADLADRAKPLLANSQLISTSAEAAPYFAAAALGMDAVPTRLAWGRHIVADPTLGAGSPDGSAGRFGRLRTRLAGDGAEAAPQGGVDLGEGEFLHPLEPPSLPRRRRRSRRLTRFWRALLSLLDPRLAVLVTAMTTLITVSTVIFHAAGGPAAGAGRSTFASWVDALVFTATTAYGNSDLAGAALWVELYAVGFMFVSALGLALTFGVAADAMVGERIIEALSVPRRMRNHVVVLGLGNVGYRTVQHLQAAGVEVAALESRPGGRFVAIARRQGVPVLIADAHFLDSLRALSVRHARAVVAATDDDLANLEAALAARELNPNARVVTRLFDQELAERAQQQLHITACQSVSALATPAFVAAALGDGVLSTIGRGRRLWLLAEAAVAPGSGLDGLAVRTLEADGELRVLAIRDEAGDHWRPAYPDRLRAGHEVLIAGSREAWERLRTAAAAPSRVRA